MNHQFPPVLAHRRAPLALLLLTLLCGLLYPHTAQAAPATGPIVATIASPRPSGFPENDKIWVTFYPAQGTSLPAPAVVLLHPIGESAGGLLDRYMRRLAERLAERGIGCALMALPYHLERTVGKTDSARHFLGPRVENVVQAFTQSSADVSAVATWLAARPDVDPRRLGVVGLSLGAIVAHLAMGQDARLNAGVALEGGGDLPTLYRDSLEIKLHAKYLPELLTPPARAQLATADPAHYAAFNQPRHVLMIAAARDQYVPPANATYLWNALGHPPIQWTDTNHFSFLLAGDSFAGTAAAYLNRVWSGQADGPTPLPRYHVPTFKLGLLVNLDGHVSPALTWQAVALGTRADHLSLAHLDLGESTRGPFVALAATVNPYADIGLEHRLLTHKVQPYVSLHIAF